MKNQILLSSKNPIYDREIDDPYVDSDLHEIVHSQSYEEAMYHLDTVIVPTFMDWHYAEFLRKFLEKHGYTVYFSWPFYEGSYECVYAKYISMLGLEDECQSEWIDEYEKVLHVHSDKVLSDEIFPDDLPF